MKETPSSTPSNVPDYREIELTISRQNVVDQIAALLYATGVIYDNEHVIDIVYEGAGGNETVPLKIRLKREQQVEVIQH